MKTIIIIFTTALSLHATTVSSITCTGSTVTVNATSHGIAANQGFVISGSTVSTYNRNSTASTVANANVLTFKLPTGTSCNGAATGGTISPAKQIINIGSSSNPQAGLVTINYLMWFTTTVPVPLTCNLGATKDQCPASVWASASAAENAAIVAGTTVEVYGQVTVPANTASATIQANALAQYQATQAGYAGFLLSGLGFWYDRTGWVNQ